MAISLLNYLNPTVKNPLGTNTTTPTTTKTSSPYGTNIAPLVKPVVNTGVNYGTNVANTMGIKASTPTASIQPPPTTLPSSQIAKPPVQTNASAPLPGQLSGNQSSGSSYSSYNPTSTQSLPTTPVVNQTQTNQPPAQPQTYPGLIGQAINQAGLINTTANQIGTQGQMTPEEVAARKALVEGEKNLESSPHTRQFAQGTEQAMEKYYGNMIGALTAERTANTGAYTAQAGAQNQAGGLLTNAAGLTAPVQVPYSNQYIDPQTGQPVGGGVSGSLQNAVSGVVQKVTSGQMTYSDAVSALSGYGQGGVNALQQALPQGFNIAQSNTLGGQQGSIGPAYAYAKTALTNLNNAVSGLSVGQNTNIPIINAITQGLSTTFGVGAQGVQAYKGALAEARSAIQKVLASVQGGTPTDYVGQSNALLPDNATPAQIAAAQSTLDTLGQAKVNIYGNPGASGTQNASTNSNIYSF